MNRVIHFEIHSKDPEQTAFFYRRVFGWKIEPWATRDTSEPAAYWLVTTGSEPDPGIDGGMLIRQGPAPSPGQPLNAFVCTIGVANLAESTEGVVRAGGAIAVDKQAIPGVGWLTYCSDPAGNLFGMLQQDPAA